MKEIFGGSEQSSSNQSGFGALPKNIQKQYKNILGKTQGVINSADQYFSPMDLTAGEIQAQELIGNLLNPSAIASGIQGFMNPYMDSVTNSINKQFEAPQGALASQASEAGAFGGSKFRQGSADLEQARLDAIAGAQSSNFNNALQQFLGTQQQGISNLLGFGGLERGLDLQQKQAVPASLGFASGIYSPLLNASQGESSGESSDGILPGISSFFSDKRLKRDIVRIGRNLGLNIYKYKYLWSNTPYVGYMSDEVKVLYPNAVTQVNGFDFVNYGEIV